MRQAKERQREAGERHARQRVVGRWESKEWRVKEKCTGDDGSGVNEMEEEEDEKGKVTGDDEGGAKVSTPLATHNPNPSHSSISLSSSRPSPIAHCPPFILFCPSPILLPPPPSIFRPIVLCPSPIAHL